MITEWKNAGSVVSFGAGGASDPGGGGGGSSGGGAGYVPVVDLTGDLGGRYALQPQTLYLLPDTGSADGGVHVELTAATGDVAPIYEFVVRNTGGMLTFADGIDVLMVPQLAANTVYDVRIVDGHARITAIGKPGQLVLYDSDAADQQCQDASGGWLIAPNAGAYRLYSGSGNSSAIAFEGGGIKCTMYRTSSGDGYGGGMTEGVIEFAALRRAGYRKVCMLCELQENGTTQTQSAYLIAGTDRKASQITAFNMANYAACYGTYEYSDPLITQNPAVRVEMPLPAIDRGYVGFIVHNNNGNGLKTSFIKRVWIE